MGGESLRGDALLATKACPASSTRSRLERSSRRLRLSTNLRSEVLGLWWVRVANLLVEVVEEVVEEVVVAALAAVVAVGCRHLPACLLAAFLSSRRLPGQVRRPVMSLAATLLLEP